MQHTVKDVIRFDGVGVHSGRKARMRICPAPAHYGVWFKRVDLSTGDPMIPARYDAVCDTRLCTVLGTGQVQFQPAAALCQRLLVRQYPGDFHIAAPRQQVHARAGQERREQDRPDRERHQRQRQRLPLFTSNPCLQAAT